MNGTDGWEQGDASARWLLIDDAPELDGASATAVLEMLQRMAMAIETEYAAEIIGHEQGVAREDRQIVWWPPDERQLRLDLGDDDYF